MSTQSIESRRSVSAAQAGSQLGVSKWTIYRLIAAGLLAAGRVGHQWRIDPEDIEAYQRANRNVPVTA